MSSAEVIGVRGMGWSEFFGEASALLADYLDRGRFALAEAPDLVGIGSNCARPRALPTQLEQFVSEPRSKGTIFIAFGTNVRWVCHCLCLSNFILFWEIFLFAFFNRTQRRNAFWTPFSARCATSRTTASCSPTTGPRLRTAASATTSC
jgi:hypothetical protein